MKYHSHLIDLVNNTERNCSELLEGKNIQSCRDSTLPAALLPTGEFCKLFSGSELHFDLDTVLGEIILERKKLFTMFKALSEGSEPSRS